MNLPYAPAVRAEPVEAFSSQLFRLRYRRLLPPRPIGLSLSKPGLGIGVRFPDEFRCRSVAAAGDLLFFASPKKTKEKKGDPGVCVPPLRCGQPAVLSPAGVELELASLRQSLALIRLDLRSSAHSQGFCRRSPGSESGSEISFSRLVAPISIAAYARITWARSQKYLINRGAAGFWGSDHNFAAQHPQGAPKARRIWALTPKTPDPAPAPVSIPQTPCGRAEQRSGRRIRARDCLSEVQRSEFERDPACREQRKESRSDPDFGSPFFGLPYFGEAKKGKSPAAATERHRTHQNARRSSRRKASTSSARTGLEYGFDTSARTVSGIQSFTHWLQEVKK